METTKIVDQFNWLESATAISLLLLCGLLPSPVLFDAQELARQGHIAPPIELANRHQGSDWESLLGPTADGKASEKGSVDDWSDGNLKLIWSAELGEG